MKNRILILTLILIFAVGIASAADIDLNSIKAPDSYKVVDDDALYSSLTDLEIAFEEFELDDVNETDDNNDDDGRETHDDNSFVNNTKLNYTIVPGAIKNTFNFTDELNKMYGCVELVEINNHKYTIMIWTDKENPDDIISNATECLEKLNEMNDFKPIDTTQYV